MKERQPLPDLLKGIAVIAMIQVHIMEQFARPEVLAGTIGKVSLFLGGPFAAPVFMAVMGYFLAAGGQESMGDWKTGLWRKLKRGMFLVLLGLLLNIGLNFNLLLHIFAGMSNADPLPFIFGADILPLAGFSIILIAVAEVLFKKRAMPYLLLAFLIPIATPFIQGFSNDCKYLQAFLAGPASWSYFPLFPWLAYPLLGFGWKTLEKERPSANAFLITKFRYVIIPVGVVLLAIARPAFAIITALPEYYHHGIVLFLWMTGFLAVWTTIGVFINKIATDSRIVEYIRWLGEHVTLVYVIQWLIIGNLAYYLADTQYVLQLILWFAGILLVSSCLTYLLLKFKYRWKRS